jgi:hypothetical protein
LWVLVVAERFGTVEESRQSGKLRAAGYPPFGTLRRSWMLRIHPVQIGVICAFQLFCALGFLLSTFQPAGGTRLA